jgi:2-amino-4-hydroxy-6-hydroxymethyldihydropteridine diphosphokinase
LRGYLTQQRYLLALGSNVRHARYGGPREVLAAAIDALGEAGLQVEAMAPFHASAPLGPSRRRYANTAAIVATPLMPPTLLGLLQDIERGFGRRQRGARWSARVLDLDIVLWSGGSWASERLVIPHPEFRRRTFVLAPARSVAAGWRDPVTGGTVRHLTARLTRAKPLP